MTAPTPEHIMEIGFGFWPSKTLLSAVELGVFTELAAVGELDADALRERLGLHPRSARDFFDALVALGLLDRVASRYRNTEATGLFLDRAKPSYIGGILEMVNARVYGYFGALTEALRTGLPQNETKTGGDFYDTLYGDPEKLRGFLAAMTAVSSGVARTIAEVFPWRDYRTVIDVGCAEGGVPAQIALAHPQVSGGGFDLPPVGPFFDEHVATAGLSDRLRFYPGDFFADDLPSADVLIMGHILHGFGLSEKQLLLKKAHAALPAGGALIVYDALIDDDRRENAYGLLLSLNMLIETPAGSDYTGAECRGWMRDAGFRDVTVRHLTGPDSMVVGIK
ncbi:MAG: methyltransferase [Actinophytocola sp.]|nr:methyltransferase [Actinophytocola sp.]